MIIVVFLNNIHWTDLRIQIFSQKSHQKGQETDIFRYYMNQNVNVYRQQYLR